MRTPVNQPAEEQWCSRGVMKQLGGRDTDDFEAVELQAIDLHL